MKCPGLHLEDHIGRSCIWGPYHMLLSREVTTDEWRFIQERVDEYFVLERATWHPEGMAYLVRQVSDKAVEEGREEVTIIGYTLT